MSYDQNMAILPDTVSFMSEHITTHIAIATRRSPGATVRSGRVAVTPWWIVPAAPKVCKIVRNHIRQLPSGRQAQQVQRFLAFTADSSSLSTILNFAHLNISPATKILT